MNILIKTLHIINFKGVKDFRLDFNHVTNIYGANATGKTTVFDAFLWLLFGKDSTDRKDFNIKPLDINGNKTDRTENEVSAVINVDGVEVSIRHIHKEKWTKKRGEAIAEFTGNEHLYFWNEVPLQAGEFQAKINDLLNEKVFKLITNPLYFNSMSWQDQRQVLTDISGEITDQYLISKYPELQELLNNLDGKTLKELKAMISASKKKLKENLEQIPGRIDELERSKPESINEKEVNIKIAELQTVYDDLERQIENKNEAFNKANVERNSSIQENQEKIHSLKLQKQGIEAKHRSEYLAELNTSQSGVNESRARVSQLESQLSTQRIQLQQLEQSHVSHLQRLLRDKEDIESRMSSLRELFRSVNARELNDHDTHCGECGREHEPDKLEEVREKFTNRKKEELEGINIQGKGLASDLAKRDDEGKEAIRQFEATKEAIERSILNLETFLVEAKEGVSALDAAAIVVKSVEERLNEDTEYDYVGDLIRELETKVFDVESVDLGDLRIRKATVNADIDSLKRQLTIKEQIERADKRIAELKAQESLWSQELASFEKQEFSADKYERAKAEELEARVNGMFKYAKFTLFNKLNNGGEEPTCKSTYNGVPFSDLNTAGKILVGIDIINTLSAHYAVIAPVFLDNRESVSVIPETAAQVVNLIVSPEDKVLRVA
ncbi:AAA family ATPase [Sphingobacterium suaedae]|uniref:AAA family ATPase n=2 Tax=Bacteria TaxID=2 RepID=A0ABW5KHJ5_9SPHI